MNKTDRRTAQKEREKGLKLPKEYIVKGDSLFEKGRKWGLPVNDPVLGNRARRRDEIKNALREERKRK
jgi:hypothetical protein